MDSEEFDGCTRQCRKKGAHTLVYGQCEFGEKPRPTLDFYVVENGDDGYPVGYIISIQASVFLPWLDGLPVEEQYKLLEKVAKAQPDKRRAVLESERNSWIDE